MHCVVTQHIEYILSSYKKDSTKHTETEWPEEIQRQNNEETQYSRPTETKEQTTMGTQISKYNPE